MTAADFAVHKDGKGRFPWVIVHKDSGKYLAVPEVVDLQAGPTTTTFVWHRTRREATAALAAYFAGATETSPPRASDAQGGGTGHRNGPQGA